MAKTKNGASLYGAALALFLAGTGALLYSGFARHSVYFLNVAEALAAPADKLQSARLFGTAQGVERSDDGMGLRFHLEDKDNPRCTLAVRYSGVVPDTFKAGSEVIVEGGMDADGAFRAKTLMTKCPSKYKKENRG